MGILTKKDKYDLIEKELKKYRKMTANECIDNIFKRDLTAGLVNTIDRGWQHYLHLNKLFSPMEKEGRLVQVGTKAGPSKRQEKVWSLVQ
jgi:hypothetical protein